MKKRIKNLKISDIVCECKKHISCMNCPLNNKLPCINYGAMNEQQLNEVVEICK